MILTFDEATHTYHLGGAQIPNVTTILEPLIDYSGIPWRIMEAARQRGDYVHKACELYCWGLLDEESIEPEYKPYIEAFKKFMAETKFEPEFIEQRVFHSKLRYAGTLDLGGILPPLGRVRTPRRALIDIKTTFKLMASVGPQTAAYLEAWNSTAPKDQRFEVRYGLHLQKTGQYKLLPFKEPSDMNIFLSCLNINNFMRKHK
jgi:hypothetical protein